MASIIVDMPEPRTYDAILADHLTGNRQMAFVSGPRQVGKTTACRRQADAYVNWDDVDDRELILAGPREVVADRKLDRLSDTRPVVLFDELHKYPHWKAFLKGLYDGYAEQLRIAVTGSSRLDVYRRGGDSLMGRYFLYRMHPFSVAEVSSHTLPGPNIIRAPKPIDDAQFNALWHHGGFPEPFLRRDDRFTRRWQTLRLAQLVREEIRDLTQVQHLDQLEILVRLLTARSAEQLIYANIAKEVRVAADTVRRWVTTLGELHVGFLLRPWFTNVSRSLRKEPKWYLRDWSLVHDEGKRAETFIACHLLKAVEGWNDLGLATFELGHIRDKERREVDFVVSRAGKPWLLVEAKLSDDDMSPHLERFQKRLDVPFAFQVTVNADYVDRDCFARPGKPLIVPARTFLSQLL